MVTKHPEVPWEEALRSFFLHKRATRSPKTAKWYRAYVSQLSNWAIGEGLELSTFTKRHLDAYLTHRQDQSKSPTTLHHDALTACAFTEWCYKNDCLHRDPLAEYKVRNAPAPYKYKPTDEDVRGLLKAVVNFYDAIINPSSAKGHSANNRSFHRHRTYAVELLKLDTACRIGEVFNFKVSDFIQAENGFQITVRQAKGREPRILPVSPECAEAVQQWLRARGRVINKAPREFHDEGWLFMSETGARGDEGNYHRTLKKIVRWAGLPEGINNHSQRRYSLTTHAKDENGGILYAQALAGHKDPKTTMIYVRLDADYLREKHEQVGVLKNLLTSTRTTKRKRLV